MNTMSIPRLLAPRDAGRRLGVTTSAIAALCRRGKLAEVRDSAGRRLLLEEDVEALRTEREARAAKRLMPRPAA